MKFGELQALRRRLTEILLGQVRTLRRYYDEESGGFFRTLHGRNPGDYGKSSTGTCVLSLLATREWANREWGNKAADLAESMLTSHWVTGGLDENNVFTTAFVLETYTALRIAMGKSPKTARKAIKGEEILVNALEDGAANLMKYPKSAYLTQLAVRVLRQRNSLPERIRVKVLEWSRREIDHQLALLLAESKTADVFQLAYSIILVSQLQNIDEVQPDQKLILNAALSKLFDLQLPDGSWPRSRPLFHYKDAGNAHCYEYEMLAQLLQQGGLQHELLQYLPKLERSVAALDPLAQEIGDGALGWASGHHPQIEGPESWSTASVFHFAYQLDRLLAEAFRRALFDELGETYSPPADADLSRKFGVGFLDSRFHDAGKDHSVKETVFNRLVKPVGEGAEQIKAGLSLPKSTPMSVILFGPPGTSKTELSRIIADALGWPHLVVDPSYFVGEGLDKVQAQADRAFAMLTVAERVVVLLDEFDEMVRERADAPELVSRFLTTGMLPRLAAINKSRRIVFIVATNFIDNFDFAISRRGRFDLILQVMPPTLVEKLEHWSGFKAHLAKVGIDPGGEGCSFKRTNDLEFDLGDLTFDEFGELASMAEGKTKDETLTLIQDHLQKCTLGAQVPRSENRNTTDGKESPIATWKELCRAQVSKIRIP